jgi:CDP-diacylglycerol--serine O-phosphatidyltransferase
MLHPVPARQSHRRKLLTIQVLPSLMTAGNLVAGVLATAYMVDAARATPAQAEALYVRASWLIFIGMFLDGLDGRVARMTGTTSAFGAQLDSLADAVTFGVAPAILARTLLGPAFPLLSSKLIFGLCLVYVLGAALRLARYNVESERLSREGRPHVTRVFRGLPSPAAAGVLASLVLLRHEYAVQEPTDWAILAAAPLLGLLMVSRMPYAHVMNRYLGANRAHPLAVLLMVVLVYLVVAHFVETVAGLFLVYALSGPVITLSYRMFGRPAWALHEEADEEEDEGEGGLDDEAAREEGSGDGAARRPDGAQGGTRAGTGATR